MDPGAVDGTKRLTMRDGMIATRGLPLLISFVSQHFPVTFGRRNG